MPEDIARLKEEDIRADEQGGSQGGIHVGTKLVAFLSTTKDIHQLGEVFAKNLLGYFEPFLGHIR